LPKRSRQPKQSSQREGRGSTQDDRSLAYIRVRYGCEIHDGDLEENPTAVSLRKLASALGELATYITNNVGHVVNYGERFRAGERISTGFVESAINQIVDKRCDKRQSATNGRIRRLSGEYRLSRTSLFAVTLTY
jgi:hypothetical protein